MPELQQDLARVLISEEAIQVSVNELAAQLSADYKETGHLYLIGILKGHFLFLADIARRLTILHTVNFMAVSSYGRKGAKSGEVHYYAERFRTLPFAAELSRDVYEA